MGCGEVDPYAENNKDLSKKSQPKTDPAFKYAIKAAAQEVGAPARAVAEVRSLIELHFHCVEPQAFVRVVASWNSVIRGI